MNLPEFFKRYGHTLQTDPTTDTPYIKVPLLDLSDLGYMQQALIHAVQMLSQVEAQHRIASENSVYWLCKILSVSYPRAELDGLTELAEQQ